MKTEIGLSLALALAGCNGMSGTGTGTDAAVAATDLATAPDLAAPPDLGAPPDLARGPADLLPNYVPATPHQIDTDPGNGPFGNGKDVSLTQVVAVTGVDRYVNSTNQQCRYQVWVQDPACMTPPCGMVIKAIGPKAPNPNSTGKDCPSARVSGTVLANISRGDNITVYGHVIVEVDSAPPMTVVEHQIFADSIVPLPNDKSIAPTVITDPTTYPQFTTHTGVGFDRYEGMYITLQPDKVLLQVSSFSGSGFQTLPGNVTWGDTFDGDYYPMGATMFPTVGSTYHAISAVVSARHGGELMPVRNKDFVP